MPNGDIFSVLVEPKVGGPNIAGTATHTYDAEALRCFSFHKAKYLHQLPDGQWCAAAFVCNHQASGNQLQIGSGSAEQKIQTRVTTNSDKSILNGNVGFNDIFNLAKITDDVCDESTIEVPNSKDRWGGPCSIKFTCHGDKGGMAEAMRQGFKNTAEKSDMFYHNLHQSKQVWNPCKSGRDTCIGGYDTVFYDETNMPQSLTLYVNYESGGSLGQMHYELYCPAKGSNSCDGVKFGAAVAGAFAGLFSPIVGTGIGLITTALCP